MAVDKITVEQVVFSLKSLKHKGILDPTVQDVREDLGRGRVLDIARLLPIARQRLKHSSADDGVEMPSEAVPDEILETVEYLWARMRKHAEVKATAEEDEASSTSTKSQLQRELHIARQAQLDLQQRLNEQQREAENQLATIRDLDAKVEEFRQQNKSLSQTQQSQKDRLLELEHEKKTEVQKLSIHLENEQKRLRDETERRQRTELQLKDIEENARVRQQQLSKDIDRLQHELARAKNDIDNLRLIRDRLDAEKVALQRSLDRAEAAHQTERQQMQHDRLELIQRIENLEKSR